MVDLNFMFGLKNLKFRAKITFNCLLSGLFMFNISKFEKIKQVQISVMILLHHVVKTNMKFVQNKTLILFSLYSLKRCCVTLLTTEKKLPSTFVIFTIYKLLPNYQFKTSTSILLGQLTNIRKLS